jgi:hypothetical protein
MAQTTFTGPVTSLNGFIGGPNVNAQGTSATDTQQGGNLPFLASAGNVTTLSTTGGTRTLKATENEGVIAYVKYGANGTSVSCYAFSNGAQWLQLNDPTSTVA